MIKKYDSPINENGLQPRKRARNERKTLKTLRKKEKKWNKKETFSLPPEERKKERVEDYYVTNAR